MVWSLYFPLSPLLHLSNGEQRWWQFLGGLIWGSFVKLLAFFYSKTDALMFLFFWNESIGFPLQFRWWKGSFGFTDLISSTAFHSIPKPFSHSSRKAPGFTFLASAVGTRVRDTANVSPDVPTRQGERKPGKSVGRTCVSVGASNVLALFLELVTQILCVTSEKRRHW